VFDLAGVPRCAARGTAALAEQVQQREGKTMTRFLILAPLVLLVAGCFKQAGSGPPAQAADPLDVDEAAFRYRLQQYSADVIAYLSIDDQDPPAELLKRLRKDWSNLKPASEEPKEKGLRIYAKGLEWQGRDTAKLHVGYWFPTRFAGEGGSADYHLLRENGVWQVNKVTNQTSS
jgi:hypothetical protein